MATSTSRKLPEMFDDVWKIYDYLETTDDATTSETLQCKVVEGVSDAEKAVHMVNVLQLFSDNETMEDVKTSELQYMLLPALLAFFTNKNCKEERSEVIKKSQQYYRDFLRLCEKYEVPDVTIPSLPGQDGDSEKEDKPRVPAPPPSESQRQAKVARFRQQKQREEKLRELLPQVRREHVDEEVKREYFLTLIKRWVNYSLDELDSIESELPILEHMAKLKKEGKSLKPAKPPAPREASRPFIITRDAVQKQVYGLGYPGVPTYSLEEFYEHQLQQGRLPDRGIPASSVGGDPDAQEAAERERAEVERERREEEDDEDTLRAARERDEWRDDHRRGWGNTHNKG